jgi:2-haloacid dehalogenase
MARHYKPDPEVYHTAVQILGLAASDVMMVAAHRNDLEAARKAGMKTAFVPRPLEHGPEGKAEIAPEVDVVAADFLELAEKLGA